MANGDPSDRRRSTLADHSPGPITATPDLERLLAEVLGDFAGDDGGMNDTKLFGRMERVVGQPPKFIFRIERHGATVMGSSRAELQERTIDLEQRTKTVQVVGRRQVRPMQGRLDVQPHRPGDRRHHSRRATRRPPEVGRRGSRPVADRRSRRRWPVGKRLRQAVAGLIAPAGWKMAKVNVFMRDERMVEK